MLYEELCCSAHAVSILITEGVGLRGCAFGMTRACMYSSDPTYVDTYVGSELYIYLCVRLHVCDRMHAGNDVVMIKKLIDIGPAAIMIRWVNTVQDAKDVVSACRYMDYTGLSSVCLPSLSVLTRPRILRMKP